MTNRTDNKFGKRFPLLRELNAKPGGSLTPEQNAELFQLLRDFDRAIAIGTEPPASLEELEASLWELQRDLKHDRELFQEMGE